MTYMIAFVLVVIALLILRNKQSSQKPDNRFKSIKTKKIENISFVDKIVQQLAGKIDLEKNDHFLKQSLIAEKCIRSGIRGADEHKKWVIFRIIGIFVGMFMAYILVSFLLGMTDIPILALVALGGGVMGFFYPIIRLDSMIEDRKKEMSSAFPDFVDLTLVCVEAGMTAEQTYARIINDLVKFSPVLADEIQLLSKEITYFLSPKIAYDNFYYRTNSEYVKAFCGVVLQSLQYGTPLAQGLRSLSAEIREAQMGMIERKAAALPSKLTVPMMLFTLPVLFTVILYPAINQAMSM